MLKIVLLVYSQGLISSRTIEQACKHNVQFIAISGDSQPSHSHIAKFVANLSTQIKPLFSQVLMTCYAQGLHYQTYACQASELQCMHTQQAMSEMPTQT